MLRWVVMIVLVPGSIGYGQNTTNFPTIGAIDRFHSAVDNLLPANAKIEVLVGGFDWSEGPVWVKEQGGVDGGYLLFSDIPKNAVMKWQEGRGVTVYLQPSGYTGVGDYGEEPGSNGLALDALGRLVSCEHGDRRVSVLTRNGGKRTLADRWEGKRFNSPNDLAIRSDGSIYFTDPIYGLPHKDQDERRDVDFCGVYRIQPDGTVTLEYRNISRPNGIAFSPDEKTLYVANSDGSDPVWRAFPVKEDGALGDPRAFFDARDHQQIGRGGGDGLKVDRNGNLFATGPGGVLILSSSGKLLGRIRTGESIANVGWGNDGSVLYLTSDMYLCRVKTKTRGAGW